MSETRRRSQREAKPTLKAKSEKSQQTKEKLPKDEATECILTAYKKVCRTAREEKNLEIRKAWRDNRHRLDRDLQSHKSFHHLHTASRLFRSRRSDSSLSDTQESTTCIPELNSETGRKATVKLFSPKDKSSSNSNETPLPMRKGPGRPTLKRKATTSTGKKKEEEPEECQVQKVPVQTITWLEKIPPVVSWTSIPFNVAEEDGKFLTNIPFLGDEVIDKDRKFIDDMLTLYQGKLHDLNNKEDDGAKLKRMKIESSQSHSSHKLEDHILISLVEILKQSGINRKREGPADKEINPSESQPTDDTQLCPGQDDLIFSVISQVIRGNGTGPELKARYEAVLKRQEENCMKRVKKQSYTACGFPAFDPASYSIPNIDGPYAKELPRENTMHAFQCLFCRRCYQYDCPRGHNGDDQVDLAHCKKIRSYQPFAIPYQCENPNCWKIKKEGKEEKPCSQQTNDWAPADKSMFLSLIQSFPDPCYVAHLMLTKDCNEVHAYSLLAKSTNCYPESELPSNSSLCQTSSSANGNGDQDSKPGGNGSGKRRSKKSSSVSKKNLSRRWINSVRKNVDGVESSEGKVPLPPRFMPCQHHDQGLECDERNPDCYCAKNGTSCEKFCSCPPTCKIRFPGCRCTSTCDSRRCVCFVAARECDPDLCTGCGAHERDVDKITCRNVNIQKRLHKHLLMGRSDVAGWGIFIKEDAQKGEFIAEYRGEIISHDESERRGHVYDKIAHTFLFELNDHFVVDATRKGNKSRFVNSSKTPNCEVKRMLVNGDHRIGIYAKRFIDAGEELFYDYEDVLEKQQRVATKMKNADQGSSVTSEAGRKNY